MRWWRRKRPVGSAVASDPTLESLHLSLNGWSERSRHDVGMPLRLWVDDVESAIEVTPWGLSPSGDSGKGVGCEGSLVLC
ncbi:MAG TPA: hypothetical protein VKB47_16840 [Terracidiphilus sp.]|nr:hypothetical protein [Terracidiphilus sp.]